MAALPQTEKSSHDLEVPENEVSELRVEPAEAPMHNSSAKHVESHELAAHPHELHGSSTEVGART